MDQNDNGQNQGQSKKLLKLFLKTVAITLTICLVGFGALAAVYYNMFRKDIKPDVVENSTTTTEKKVEPEKEEISKINKTIAVFGVDQDETRTDVIMVVNFNSETNKVKVVSVPRDTKVIWSEEQKDKLRQIKDYSINYSKINEMSAYSGINNIRYFTIDEIENLLGVNIDNYILINIDAFNEIVDAVGGVEVDVPMDMYYVDQSQGLYINLKKGLQTLDGKDAEGLVRFRYGYKEGDVGRIETQKVFLKALAEKILSKDTIDKIPTVATKLFSHISTDIKLSEIPTYLSALKTFDVNNLEFYTVPGEGAYENGVSYYFIDDAGLEEMVQKVFYDQTEEEDTEALQSLNAPIIDKAISIEVLNGAGINGLAGSLKGLLEEEGYTVANVDNYTRSDLLTSVIYTKDRSLANQFKDFLPEGIKVLQKATIENDVQIILGQDFIVD